MTPKQLLLTLALFLSVAFMKAQDKYEFMIISYYPPDGSITIAVDGQQLIKGKIDGNKDEKFAGLPLLKLINEYQDKKWEVMTFTNPSMGGPAGLPGTCVYLKRKK